MSASNKLQTTTPKRTAAVKALYCGGSFLLSIFHVFALIVYDDISRLLKGLAKKMRIRCKLRGLILLAMGTGMLIGMLIPGFGILLATALIICGFFYILI